KGEMAMRVNLAARSLCVTLVALASVSLPLSARTAGGSLYEIIDLGTLGGATTVANYINNRGQVVGTSRTAAGFQRAFLYSGGIMQDLGTLGGSESFGNVINDRGQVGGAAFLADGSRHAFLFDGGVMDDLGALPGSAVSNVFGLNNRGQAVGGS